MNETQMFYASLNHSYEEKCRKPRNQIAYLPVKNEGEQLCAMDASASKTTLVDSVPLESQAIEENIHDDPIRLFGLIRAKKESTDLLEYDLAQWVSSYWRQLLKKTKSPYDTEWFDRVTIWWLFVGGMAAYLLSRAYMHAHQMWWCENYLFELVIRIHLKKCQSSKM